MFVTKVNEEATCVCVWMCMQVCGTMWPHVMCCRSAKQMPQSVREALKQVVIAKGQRSEEAAEQFIKDMEIKCLYQTETWS